VRVAFFGLPLAACLLAADGHEIVLAGMSRTGAPGTRRLTRLIGRERLVVRPAIDAALAARVREARADLVVSWFWTTRLSTEIVRAAPLGAFGVHPSLLPRHRGPDPTYWTILEGDEETGVTAHRIAPDYDTGAILDARRVRVDPTWNAWHLARALDRSSLALLRDVARRFATGRAPAETPQREEDATLAPFPDEDAQWIRWSRPTSEVLRQVRALAPAPGALTELGDEVVAIVRARAANAHPLLEVPGEAMLFEGRPLIRTLDGAVSVEEAEIDGERIEPGDWGAVFAVED
jgi:methionyl-tRNA formyltransferase